MMVTRSVQRYDGIIGFKELAFSFEACFQANVDCSES